MLDDPDQMTPDARAEEVATVLAEGVLRLRRRPQLDPVSLVQIEPESSQNELDVSPDTPLHVADGLTPARAQEGSGT